MNYITKINGLPVDNFEQYMQHMAVGIARGLDIIELGLYRYNAERESVECLDARIDGIIAGINRGDLIICQFPTGNGLKFEWALINHLKAYGGRIAILLHYIEKSLNLQELINLYNQAEIMIIPSLIMRNFLIDNHIRKNMKFVIQEMWDYITDVNNFNILKLKKIFAVIDLGRYGDISELRSTLPLQVYKVSDDLCVRKDLCGFGLVWYSDESDPAYMEYVVSFLMGKFLAAGLPVIIPSGIWLQSLIEKNHLGIVVESLREVMTRVDKMNESEYLEYVQCVQQFAPALRKGYYTQRSMAEAIQMFYRKGVGRLSAPAKIYSLGQSAFLTTVLKESYRGKFALSWSFKGDADGFLVCDGSGIQIFETDNIHQHYYLIDEYEKESSFVVKAYVETLKGKLVIAESKFICLDEREYKSARVSLIIPAYNAEDYIVRSIDTALGQSFPDLEVIIVDDGSTDDTPQILDWYNERYSNVIAIHQENSGVAEARNTGIRQATGEYIGFMDNDDMIHPEMVAQLYYSAKKNCCDIAITSVHKITNKGYENFIQYPMQEDIDITIEDFFNMHFYKGCMFAVVIWNKLYRASLVKQHLIPRLISDDDAWTPYILSHADKICYLNGFLYEWDRKIRNSTQVDQWQRRSREELFQTHKDTILFYLNNGNPERLGLLKQLARRQLSEMRKAYAYDAYEKLWEWIEEMF